MSTTDSIGLLREYADHGDEAAFGEIVDRYVDLVYSTALRRVGGDADLARDVTQTVFTDLARKARSLREVAMLGGWLHRHTGFVSATVVRSERRRRAREQEAAEMNALQNSPDSFWHQLAPVLDEAIDGLDEADREAIVMRFYEQRDFRSLGAALGVSDDAAQKRVSRALEKLRLRLASQGVALGLGALASLMAARAVSAAPAGLSGSARTAALAGAGAGTELWLVLARLAGSSAGKWGLGMTVAALAIGGWLWTNHPGARSPAATVAKENSTAERVEAAPPSATSVSMASDASAQTAPADSARELLLHIVAADTGRPVPRAAIECRFIEAGMTQAGAPMELTSSEAGLCAVPLPAMPPRLLMIRSRVDGFADTTLAWSPERGESVPEQYTLRLARSTPIGGLVLDQAGYPVPGAQVRISCLGVGQGGTAAPHLSAEGAEVATTDSQGRWRMDRFAKGTICSEDGRPELMFQAVHPDYFRERPFMYGNGVPREIQKELLAGTYVFRLARKLALRGTVVDADGHAVPNVKIGLNPASVSSGLTNQADGSFSVTGRAGRNSITFEASGYALAETNVDLEPNMAPLRVALQAVRRLRLKVTDPDGHPVSGAEVVFRKVESDAQVIATGASAEGLPAITVTTPFDRQTDAQGRVSWGNPPSGGFSLEITAPGMRRTNVWMKADGLEHMVKLAWALTISGTVRDTDTGQPIPRFNVSAGTRDLWISSRRFSDGKFRLVVANILGATVMFKFEANGYVPVVTRAVRADAGEVLFDIRMQAAPSIPVMVLQPDGTPDANADIGLVGPGEHLQVVPGGLWRSQGRGERDRLSTDDQGRFTLPPCEEGTWVVAAAPAGYAETTPGALAADPTLRLLPWGRVEGTFYSSGNVAAGTLLRLTTSNPFLEALDAVRADENGHFEFPKVPAGKFRLMESSGSLLHPSAPTPLGEVTVGPGETQAMTVGAYTVIARLSWPEGSKPQADWSILAYYFRNKLDGSTPRGRDVNTKPDGSLTAKDLTAGSYLLKVNVGGPPAGNGRRKILFQAEAAFTVPAQPISGTLNLGRVALQATR